MKEIYITLALGLASLLLGVGMSLFLNAQPRLAK